MDRKSNSSGRGKHVSGSSGSVGKHGDCLNLGSGHRGSSGIGMGSGSSGTRSSSNRSSGTRSGNTRSSGSVVSSLVSGLTGSASKKKKKRILIVLAIVVVCFVGYYFYSSWKSNQSSQESQTSSAESTVVDSESDSDSTDSDDSDDETSESESSWSTTGEARDYYCDTANAETVTVMVYMCGADLESSYGCATADLKEMLNASHSSDVHIVYELGGCSYWRNSWVGSTTKNQYAELTADGDLTVLKNITKASMTDPDTLSAFIKYASKEFPADRYILIFWDHGGGSVSGYGYDELFSSSGSMTVDEIDDALTAGGVKFDFIGFDACLMANIETAVACEKHADYLIASEETEPGGGWYYTNWLTKLCENPSIDTVSLGKTICDTFYNKEHSNGDCSLSVIDLAEFSGKPLSAFNEFSSYLVSELSDGGYTAIAKARSNTKEFASSSKINQIDLIHFAKKLGTTTATNFINDFESCVKYSKTSLSNTYGISVYFPYTSSTYVSKALSIYDEIGMVDSYCTCVRNFASILTGGQISSTSTGSSSSSLTGDTDSSSTSSSSTVTNILEEFFSGSSSSSSSALETIIEVAAGTTSTSSALGDLWDYFSDSYSSSSSSSSYGSIISNLFSSDSNSSSSSLTSIGSDLIESLFKSDTKTALDRQVMFDNADFYADTLLNASDFVATKKNKKYVLSLTDEQWDLIQDNLYLNMFVKDEEGGFIDLGWDSVYEFTDDGDLLLTQDELTWIAINDQFVAVYCYDSAFDEDGSLSELYYRVPCLVNGEPADLIMHCSQANDWYFEITDVVYGYNTVILAKTDVATLAEGDEIQFIADYYDENGSFDNQYMIGDAITVGSAGLASLTVTDKPIESSYGVYTNYRLTDIYNNAYWTQTLKDNKTLVK